jgi:hypothetical protein
MKGKFYILLFVFSTFSIAVAAQSKNKKNDSTTSAKQIISKDQGEKDLPNQLKKEQLQKQPETLKNPAADSTSAKNKHKRTKHKHKKGSK